MKHSDRKDHDVVDATGKKIGETNPDPITGEPGSHPVGTGIGAAGAGAVGAAIGAVAGPVGALAGAAIGAVVGGLAGHGIAEAIDPTAEEAFWRDEYQRRPYFKEGHTYDDYAPAYRLGTEHRVKQQRNPIRSWENIEGTLGEHWDGVRGDSRLAWDDARPAARDAWHRTHERLTMGTTPEVSTGATRSISSTSDRDMDPVAVRDTSVNRDIPAFDPVYYQEVYVSCPYKSPQSRFLDYEPAYRFGHNARHRFSGREWEEVEPHLRRDWETEHRGPSLKWEQAKEAVRDAWDRAVHHHR